MNYSGKIFTAAAALVLCCSNIFAQEQNPQDTTAAPKPAISENAPMFRSEGEPRLYYIRDVNVHGVQYLNPEILKSSAGLIAGDSVYLPSNFISNAISRLWSQRFFSDVKIGAEIEGDSLDLEVFLKERPRVYNWEFEGISKGKKKDLLEKLKLKRGSELSDYVIDKNKKLIHNYWAEKGFRNTEVDVRINNDTLRPGQAVTVTFLIDRKEKVKIGKINFVGNEQFNDKRLRRTFKKTHQKSINFFKGTKLNENDYEADKELLIDFYNSRGYRNATIIRDSIYPINEKRLGIDLEVSEGNKYYIRNVSWVGNSVYETEGLQQMFGVKKGDIFTEGYATENGELALGRNLLVAYMPWKGYNYEDAIVLNERMVREDILTSVHVDEYSLEVRETKRGMETLTNDIPNVSEDATKDLDENGIVRIGARIVPGDIMIGKITPKGESDPTPEEKLLRAIFGDKAGDVKDASLKVPPSIRGVVIDKKLFARIVRDRKQRAREKEILAKPEEEYNNELAELKEKLVDRLLLILAGKTSNGVYTNHKEELIPKKVKFTAKALKAIDYTEVSPNKWTTDKETNDLIKDLLNNYNIKNREINGRFTRNKFALTVGDDLPSGIVQMAKVYIAMKRKLRIGDKMAGRHGNKGIVSKIVRAEDMPFLADGTPVDIVLNPLGVPSRMNLGQIYETVLGWAGKVLNKRFKTPIFDGATLEQINGYMREAGLPENGRTYLYDGETGERFDQPATVGYIYYLKLHHMVDDKMHARSIGPYSLITQQPLGGKANFGGQRFGEMEVWALEAYGASHVLQEVLTVKSDDVMGRAKAYESIVKGDNMPTPGIPESFNVLVHELRGLGLEVTFD